MIHARPLPSPFSLKEIHLYAANVLDEAPQYLIHDYKTRNVSNCYVDVFSLALHLGAKIKRRGSNGEKDGHLLTVRGKGEMSISLGDLTPNNTDRYETAVALGHYFLHYLLPGIDKVNDISFVDFSLYGMGLVASEQVKVFAYSLLMPEVPFMESLLYASEEDMKDEYKKFSKMDHQFKVRTGMSKARYALFESFQNES